MKELPIGTALIYFNQWTGFETKEFRGKFVPFTEDEIKNLKKDDVIYVDVDPLHPQGKVYGWVKATVMRVVPLENGEFQIAYNGVNYMGTKRTKDGLCIDIERAVDEQALADIAARLPLSTQIELRA
jgi:hypothetical protein